MNTKANILKAAQDLTHTAASLQTQLALEMQMNSTLCAKTCTKKEDRIFTTLTSVQTALARMNLEMKL